MSDAIKRQIEVVPDGKAIEQVFTDRLKDTVKHKVAIPNIAIDDASRLFVKVYPGVMSQVLEHDLDPIAWQPRERQGRECAINLVRGSEQRGHVHKVRTGYPDCRRFHLHGLRPRWRTRNLSCGRLDIWSGPPLSGPPPGPGKPGDCAP